MEKKLTLKLRLVGAMLLFSAGARCAADTAGSSPEWKLSATEYAYPSYGGTDFNLRWRAHDRSAWAGLYSDTEFGTQARAGADTTIQVAKYLQIQPSIAGASGGFVGASVNLQAGADWYGLVGFGRTDGRAYFNLNFDPNDARTFGAGHHVEGGISYLIFVVADDRFHTGQRDWHVNVQLPFGPSHATLDLLRKSGLSDAGRVNAWGFTANWDWPKWFLRAAYDPYQNFSAQNVWRFSSGVRF